MLDLYAGSRSNRRTDHRCHKAITIALLWIGIGASAGFLVPQGCSRLLLAIVAVGVTIHILWLGTD